MESYGCIKEWSQVVLTVHAAYGVQCLVVNVLRPGSFSEGLRVKVV